MTSTRRSELVIRRDEETGDRSEVQTEIGRISEVDENEEVSTVGKGDVNVNVTVASCGPEEALVPPGDGRKMSSSGRPRKAVGFSPME